MADETEREALAPCPFCGGEPRVEHTYVGEGYDGDFHMVARICCSACQIGGSYTDAPDQGASRWNRRVGVNPSRHRAEVEAAFDACIKAAADLRATQMAGQLSWWACNELLGQFHAMRGAAIRALTPQSGERNGE